MSATTQSATTGSATIRRRRAPAAVAAGLIVLAAACHGPGGGSSAARGWVDRLEEPRAHAAEPATFDVEHYALDLALDPDGRRLDGTCRVRFVALEPLDGLVLDLEGLEVDAVRDARGAALDFEHADGRLAIRLGRRLAAGEAAEVVVRYGGRPAKGLWFVAERDGVPTQVFTQGECEDARWWFPCRDVPSERATSELRVTLPVHWRAIAAGERVERREDGPLAHELWRTSFPHPSYLETLVAGELVEERAAWDGVPLVALAPPELAAYVEPAFERTGDVLAFFSELTGVRYPYPKYGQACVADFPFGGMENVSATTLTETTLKDERGRRDGTSEGLVAHEAAHQWFGDLLTCRDWSHIWLNEGFATYLTVLWFEHAEGTDALRRRMRRLHEDYTGKDVGDARRPTVHDVFRDPMDLFLTGHAYPGGASRLHQLRFVVGERAFRRGLKLYVGRNAGRSVVTDDLRAAMEDAAGEDLGWFFDQWLERPGFPELEVRWRYDASRARVHLAVDQVQEIADGTPAAFRAPVDVEVRTASGRRTHRVTLERRRHIFDLPCDEPPLWVRFDKGGWLPKTLRSRKDAREWLLIAAEDDDLNGRLDAVRALGERLRELAPKAEGAAGDTATAAVESSAPLGSDDDAPPGREDLVLALLERLATDADHTVRAAAADELGQVRERLVADAVRARRAAAEASRGPSDEEPRVREDDLPEAARLRAALERAAAEDAEASVRVAALNALARAVDGEAAAFAERVFDDGYSWNTTVAAARLGAKARRATGEEALARAWVEERMARPSPHAVLRAGLVGVLAELGGRDALERLSALAANPTEHDAVRGAAARGAARVARELDLGPAEGDELRVATMRELAELLKEPSFRLRRAAVDALASFDDPRVAPVLLARYERSVFPRERRAIERAIHDLAGGDLAGGELAGGSGAQVGEL